MYSRLFKESRKKNIFPWKIKQKYSFDGHLTALNNTQAQFDFGQNVKIGIVSKQKLFRKYLTYAENS